jgi:hypothetical protein
MKEHKKEAIEGASGFCVAVRILGWEGTLVHSLAGGFGGSFPLAGQTAAAFHPDVENNRTLDDGSLGRQRTRHHLTSLPLISREMCRKKPAVISVHLVPRTWRYTAM